MNKTPNPEAIVRKVNKQLREFVNLERREKAKTYFPTSMRVLGVAVTDLRPIARRLARELHELSGEQALAIAQHIIDDHGFESRQVGFELVKLHPTAHTCLNLKCVEALGAGNDNWASVDSFACDVAGPAWREGLISDAAVRRWSESRDPWWRRTALVCTIALNMKSRGGAGDIPRTLELCERLAGDEHEMVAKGLSWALRTLITHDAGAVEAFLERHQEVLAKRVLREVRNKLDTGKKSGR